MKGQPLASHQPLLIFVSSPGLFSNHSIGKRFDFHFVLEASQGTCCERRMVRNRTKQSMRAAFAERHKQVDLDICHAPYCELEKAIMDEHAGEWINADGSADSVLDTALKGILQWLNVEKSIPSSAWEQSGDVSSSASASPGRRNAPLMGACLQAIINSEMSALRQLQ